MANYAIAVALASARLTVATSSALSATMKNMYVLPIVDISCFDV
jgi:hypothetical protein